MQLLFVVLIILVITSTLDNALSAIVSILAVDIVPLVADQKGDQLLRTSRILTLAIAIIGVGIAVTEPSVLFLLLRADLLASATVVPILLGLYTPRLGGTAAFSATLLGMIGGVPWFLAENYLFSFTTALVLSAGIAVVWLTIRPAEFSFEELKQLEDLE
jgi:Na+/proline symporter